MSKIAVTLDHEAQEVTLIEDDEVVTRSYQEAIGSPEISEKLPHLVITTICKFLAKPS